MRIFLGVSLALLALSLAVIGGAAWKIHRLHEDARLNNVVFESSDGRWTDCTEHFKGRDFYAVVWTFEAYRLLQEKPEVTLLRVTRRPVGARDEIEWKVPLGRPSGKAKSFLSGTKAGQREEIARRAKATLEYWEKK